MEYIENTPLLHHPLENLDLDKLMSEKLGDFGLYQKWIYFLVCLPAALTAGITLSSVFTADIPLHRCQVRNYLTLIQMLSLNLTENTFILQLMEGGVDGFFFKRYKSINS